MDTWRASKISGRVVRINGKEDGNYYVGVIQGSLGFGVLRLRDNGKEHGNYYVGVI